MESSHQLLGGYFSKPIDIRRFKTENTYKINQIKLSKITDRTIITKLKSISPNVDLSNLINEMKQCEAKLQKHNYQEIFDSPDILNARCIPPIYDTVNSDLQILKVVKSDLYQTKRLRLYSPPPIFTPRGFIVPGQTLLITVSLYYPFHWVKDQEQDEAVIPHFNEAIQFYDTQTLHDLKRAFRCVNVDSEISGDISENPHKPLEYLMSSDLKQALFYINNNIYVDSLHGTTITYAETIKEWAKSQGWSIRDIHTMDTELLDLEVRIGQPYVYQHLGRCEHLIIFNEISFAQPSDCLGRNNYPRIINTAKERLKNCLFCAKSIASIVMVNHNDRTPVTVNHMCEPCFLSYNYDNVGDKVADFKAYRTIKWKK